MPSFVEGLNSAIGSRLCAGNASNLWLDYLQDYESDKELTRERKISDPSLARTGALKGNYNPFSESWEWNYKPEPQGGFFGFNIIVFIMIIAQSTLITFLTRRGWKELI